MWKEREQYLVLCPSILDDMTGDPFFEQEGVDIKGQEVSVAKKTIAVDSVEPDLAGSDLKNDPEEQDRKLLYRLPPIPEKSDKRSEDDDAPIEFAPGSIKQISNIRPK